MLRPWRQSQFRAFRTWCRSTAHAIHVRTEERAPALAHVDVVNEGQVEAKEPPALRQAQRVVARLLRQQPANHNALFDQDIDQNANTALDSDAAPQPIAGTSIHLSAPAATTCVWFVEV